MRYPVYKASEWISSCGVPFIYSHALNRPLNPELHCHDFYEIIFLFSGNVSHCVNNVTYEMRDGDAAFLRPFDTHIFTEQSQQLELFSISVVAEELGPLLSAYHIDIAPTTAKKEIHFSLSHGQQHTLLSMFRQIKSVTTPQREIILRIILGEALHELMRQQCMDSVEWIDKILAQMNTLPNMAAGVPALLRLSNLSHAQLCRLVKKHIGQTPQHYIKELRLTHAYEMIQSTDIPFEQIALQVGYSSFSHFSVAFKQRFGLSPAVLRKSSQRSTLI